MDWTRDGAHWPHRERSRFVQAAGLSFHVQVFPGPANDAPVAVLLHGTGASTHSWRDLVPLLARHCIVVVPDLPGHAFTGMPAQGAGSAQLGLPGMARSVAALLTALQMKPALLVGHSAGAAVAARMALDHLAAPDRIVGINAALLPLGGLAGQWFSPAAKLMAAVPLVPQLFAWRARSPAVLDRLLGSTGSRLNAEGRALYQRLVSDPDHVAGALAMMANWDLPQLARDLPRLATRLDLIVGDRDQTVPPADSNRVMESLGHTARGNLHALPGLGHLAHEEAPEQVATLLGRVLDQLDMRGNR